MRAAYFCGNAWKSVFSLASGELFENAARDPLQFAKTGQVVLKFGVHELRFLRTQLDTQDHVAKLDGMRKKSVFLEFLESGFGVIVIHSFLRAIAGVPKRSREGIIVLVDKSGCEDCRNQRL
jgi:hypothetical protein